MLAGRLNLANQYDSDINIPHVAGTGDDFLQRALDLFCFIAGEAGAKEIQNAAEAADRDAKVVNFVDTLRFGCPRDLRVDVMEQLRAVLRGETAGCWNGQLLRRPLVSS
jgi:hypothetical protein